MGFFMSMVANSRLLAVLISIFVCWLSSCSLSYATPTDIYCLKTIKESLEDPFSYLNSSWDFNNHTEGFICRFTGIECWNSEENKVLNIRLSGMGLKGLFPQAIKNCSSLVGLDLSSNEIYGSIPADIGDIFPFATSLDLSSNNFSGEIPKSLVNCSYLNLLKLDNNRLSGPIPLELGLLSLLKSFSVSNNLLTGQVPQFVSVNITADKYANNPGLCGKPLDACTAPPKKSNKLNFGIIAGAAVGGVTLAALVVGVAWVFFLRRLPVKKKEEDRSGRK